MMPTLDCIFVDSDEWHHAPFRAAVKPGGNQILRIRIRNSLVVCITVPQLITDPFLVVHAAAPRDL